MLWVLTMALVRFESLFSFAFTFLDPDMKYLHSFTSIFLFLFSIFFCASFLRAFFLSILDVTFSLSLLRSFASSTTLRALLLASMEPSCWSLFFLYLYLFNFSLHLLFLSSFVVVIPSPSLCFKYPAPAYLALTSAFSLPTLHRAVILYYDDLFPFSLPFIFAFSRYYILPGIRNSSFSSRLGLAFVF